MEQFWSTLSKAIDIMEITSDALFAALPLIWWFMISCFVYAVGYGSSSKIKQRLEEISDPRIFSRQLWLEGKEEEYRALQKQIRAQKIGAAGWGLLLAFLIPLVLFPTEIFDLILLNLL